VRCKLDLVSGTGLALLYLAPWWSIALLLAIMDIRTSELFSVRPLEGQGPITNATPCHCADAATTADGRDPRPRKALSPKSTGTATVLPFIASQRNRTLQVSR
jgi:hypothetical protein